MNVYSRLCRSRRHVSKSLRFEAVTGDCGEHDGLPTRWARRAPPRAGELALSEWLLQAGLQAGLPAPRAQNDPFQKGRTRSHLPTGEGRRDSLKHDFGPSASLNTHTVTPGPLPRDMPSHGKHRTAA